MPNNDNNENQQHEYQQAELDQLAEEELAEQAEKQKNFAKAPNYAQIDQEVVSDIQQMQQEMNIPDAPKQPAPKKEKTLDEEVDALQKQIDAEKKAEVKAPQKPEKKAAVVAAPSQPREAEPEISDLDTARIEDGPVDENGDIQPLTPSDRVQILLSDSHARAVRPGAPAMDQQEYVAIRTLNEILMKDEPLNKSDAHIAMDCVRLMTLAERLRSEKRNQVTEEMGPLAKKIDGLSPPEIRKFCRADQENTARTSFVLGKMSTAPTLSKKVLWRFLSEDGAKLASMLIPAKGKPAPAAKAAAPKPKGPVRQPLYQPAEVKKKPVAQTYQKTGSDLRKLCEDMRSAHSIFGKTAYDNVEKALNQVSKDWDSNAAARDPKKARDDMQHVLELSTVYLAGKAKDADKLTGVAKKRYDAVSNVMKLMNKQIMQLNRVLDKRAKAAEKPDPVKKQDPLMKL